MNICVLIIKNTKAHKTPFSQALNLSDREGGVEDGVLSKAEKRDLKS